MFQFRGFDRTPWTPPPPPPPSPQVRPRFSTISPEFVGIIKSLKSGSGIWRTCSEMSPRSEILVRSDSRSLTECINRDLTSLVCMDKTQKKCFLRVRLVSLISTETKEYIFGRHLCIPFKRSRLPRSCSIHGLGPFSTAPKNSKTY